MVHPHPATERTFVIIKPDGVQRSLVGEIIKRFERTGLKIVHLSMRNLEPKKVWEHYGKDDAWFIRKGEGIVKDRQAANMPVEKEAIEYGKEIIGAMETYLTASPVVVIVLQGNRAVNVVKKLVGGTDPDNSDVGTIRGDFTIDSYNLSSVEERALRNLAHCSDSPEEAQREIKLWLKPEEILNYKLAQEQVLYDVNLDGVME